MADMFKLKLKGIKELQRKFKQIDSEMQQALSQATSAAASVVVREAKINSDRGGEDFPNRRTGTLMRNIKEVRKEKSPTRCVSQVGATVGYALRLEKGFTDTDSLGRRYHQPPRPFLRPALDENEKEIQKAFVKKVEDVLKKYR